MNNELLLILVYFFGLLQGIVFSYLRWGPDSAFKQGMIDGMTFKFLRRKK